MVDIVGIEEIPARDNPSVSMQGSPEQEVHGSSSGLYSLRCGALACHGEERLINLPNMYPVLWQEEEDGRIHEKEWAIYSLGSRGLT